jgi:adenylate kinase
MKLIFFGPPGTGKGTYASRIGPKLGIPHISTGDIFRGAITSGSELGREAEKYMKAGNLVPDDVVIGIIKDRINQEDCKNGFILDGYPRTTEQASALEKITDIDLVINFVLSEEIIIEKTLARRICEKCGAIYNIADINRDGVHMPPLLTEKEGVCDKCGGKIIQRKDDNEATIRERLKIYKEQSEPLIEYYKEKGFLKTVKVIGPPETMVPIILDVIEKHQK